MYLGLINEYDTVYLWNMRWLCSPDKRTNDMHFHMVCLVGVARTRLFVFNISMQAFIKRVHLARTVSPVSGGLWDILFGHIYYIVWSNQIKGY